MRTTGRAPEAQRILPAAPAAAEHLRHAARQGDTAATIICGTMMAAETTSPAAGVRFASSFSASGSIAALARWNSTAQTANTCSAGSRKICRGRIARRAARAGAATRVFLAFELILAPDRMHRRQRGQHQRGRHDEDGAFGQVPGEQSQQSRGCRRTKRRVARVDPQPLTVRGVAAQPQRDRGDRRVTMQAAARPAPRPSRPASASAGRPAAARQQRWRPAHRSSPNACSAPHPPTSRQATAQQRGARSDAQRDADIGLAPACRVSTPRRTDRTRPAPRQ